jgi:hypothetical protein
MGMSRQTRKREAREKSTPTMKVPHSLPEGSLMSDVGLIDAAQLRVNAIHEAGHAVAMTLIGRGCEVTTVDPQEIKRLTGHAMPGYTHPSPGGLRVDIYLCTTFAGVMSEAMYATNGMINPKEDDFTHVEEILDRAGMQGEERKESRERAEARTHQLLTMHEADVKAVAKALVERKTLTGDEVRQIIETASGAVSSTL